MGSFATIVGPAAISNKIVYAFDVDTAGSGAVNTLASINLPAGTYEIEIEGLFPYSAEDSTGTLSISSPDETVWNPFTSTPNAEYTGIYTGTTVGELTLTKTAKMILTYNEASTFTVTFTDYTYGSPIEVSGIVTVTPVTVIS
jgi:hypothetical protein